MIHNAKIGGGTEQWELIADVTFDEPQDMLGTVIFPEGYEEYIIDIFVKNTTSSPDRLQIVFEKPDGTTEKTRASVQNSQNIHIVMQIGTIMIGGKPYLNATQNFAKGINSDLNEFPLSADAARWPILDLSGYKRIAGVRFNKPIGIAGSYYKIYGRKK